MSKGQRDNTMIIAARLPPDVLQQFNEIFELAKLVRPKMTRTDVIVNLVRDQYRKLVAAKILPLLKPPEIVNVTSTVRSNGHGYTPNGE